MVTTSRKRSTTYQESWRPRNKDTPNPIRFISPLSSLFRSSGIICSPTPSTWSQKRILSGTCSISRRCKEGRPGGYCFSQNSTLCAPGSARSKDSPSHTCYISWYSVWSLANWKGLWISSKKAAVHVRNRGLPGCTCFYFSSSRLGWCSVTGLSLVVVECLQLDFFHSCFVLPPHANRRPSSSVEK